MKRFLFAVLSVFTFASGVSASGNELSAQQKSFLQEFLGITSYEASRSFEVKPLNGSEWGHVWPDDQKTIYLNVNDGGIRLNGTLIHESIHLHQYHQKPNEEKWAMEGFALLGEFLYDLRTYGKKATFMSFLPIVDAYLKDKNRSFFTYDHSPADQGKVFLFFLFAYETFGQNEFSQAEFKSQPNGILGIEDASETDLGFALIPKSPERAAKITERFQKSVEAYENVSSIRMNDFFSQILFQLKP